VDSNRLRRMALELDEEHRQAAHTIHDDLTSSLPRTKADRRSFVRGAGAGGLVVAVGGLAVGLDAMFHAAAAQTGTTTTTQATTTSGAPATTTTLPPRQPDGDDRALLGFMQSLELTAVAVYAIALNSKKLSDPIGEIVATFQAHHLQHAQALSSLAGSSAVDLPNGPLLAVLGPQFQSAPAERDLLQLTYQVENAAAASYVGALAGMTATDPAATMASILPIEARHAVVFGESLGLQARDIVVVVEDVSKAATPDKYPIQKG
jgi:Ferritin-like domain